MGCLMFWGWLLQGMTLKKFWNEVIRNKKPEPDYTRYPKSRLKPTPPPADRPCIEDMVQELLADLNEEQRNQLRSMQKGELAGLHFSYGMYIRNHFRLWDYEFVPMIDERGVDVAPDHPDALSMKVIESLWLELQ